MTLSQVLNSLSNWKEIIEQKQLKYSYIPFTFKSMRVEIHNATWCPDCEREVTDLLAFLSVNKFENLKIDFHEYEDKEDYKSKKVVES